VATRPDGCKSSINEIVPIISFLAISSHLEASPSWLPPSPTVM